MRLADFILSNTEPILAEWETFARGIWPGAAADPLTLRDHAEDILRATASDMRADQSAAQQSGKSRGEGEGGEHSVRLNGASDVHALGRVASGFDLRAVVAEYRALRASVVRLWGESRPDPDPRDLADLTRFNESIDQSLAKAVGSFTQRVDQSRQMFLGIFGHDLRTPLNTVSLWADVMSRSGRGDPDTAEVAAQVTKSVAAMDRLIHDLLDFARTALGGGIPVSPAKMDLGDFCREVLAEMRAAHPACAVHFEPQGDLRGQWDAGRLRQLVSNLVSNAIQHGGDGCVVSLTIRPENSHLLLAVHNGGPPIPPGDLATIFDPLVRGRSTEWQKQRRPGSIGLGLHIAREVATAHGGTIDVSSSEEAGTVFTVRLPRRRDTGEG